MPRRSQRARAVDVALGLLDDASAFASSIDTVSEGSRVISLYALAASEQIPPASWEVAGALLARFATAQRALVPYGAEVNALYRIPEERFPEALEALRSWKAALPGGARPRIAPGRDADLSVAPKSAPMDPLPHDPTPLSRKREAYYANFQARLRGARVEDVPDHLRNLTELAEAMDLEPTYVLACGRRWARESPAARAFAPWFSAAPAERGKPEAAAPQPAEPAPLQAAAAPRPARASRGIAPPTAQAPAEAADLHTVTSTWIATHIGFTASRGTLPKFLADEAVPSNGEQKSARRYDVSAPGALDALAQTARKRGFAPRPVQGALRRLEDYDLASLSLGELAEVTSYRGAPAALHALAKAASTVAIRGRGFNARYAVASADAIAGFAFAAYEAGILDPAEAPASPPAPAPPAPPASTEQAPVPPSSPAAASAAPPPSPTPAPRAQRAAAAGAPPLDYDALSSGAIATAIGFEGDRAVLVEFLRAQGVEDNGETIWRRRYRVGSKDNLDALAKRAQEANITGSPAPVTADPVWKGRRAQFVSVFGWHGSSDDGAAFKAVLERVGATVEGERGGTTYRVGRPVLAALAVGGLVSLDWEARLASAERAQLEARGYLSLDALLAAHAVPPELSNPVREALAARADESLCHGEDQLYRMPRDAADAAIAAILTEDRAQREALERRTADASPAAPASSQSSASAPADADLRSVPSSWIGRYLGFTRTSRTLTNFLASEKVPHNNKGRRARRYDMSAPGALEALAQRAVERGYTSRPEGTVASQPEDPAPLLLEDATAPPRAPAEPASALQPDGGPVASDSASAEPAAIPAAPPAPSAPELPAGFTGTLEQFRAQYRPTITEDDFLRIYLDAAGVSFRDDGTFDLTPDHLAAADKDNLISLSPSAAVPATAAPAPDPVSEPVYAFVGTATAFRDTNGWLRRDNGTVAQTLRAQGARVERGSTTVYRVTREQMQTLEKEGYIHGRWRGAAPARTVSGNGQYAFEGTYRDFVARYGCDKARKKLEGFARQHGMRALLDNTFQFTEADIDRLVGAGYVVRRKCK